MDIQIIEKHIGRQLRKLRAERGISQQEIGNLLGVTFQQIQKYETGQNRISGGRLLSLAIYLKVPVSDFFPKNTENLVEEIAKEEKAFYIDKYQNAIMRDLQNIKCIKKRQFIRYVTKWLQSWESK